MTRATYKFAELDQDIFNTLKNLGYQPKVIFDVGASNGYWSWLIREIVPEAEYHLFEPLVDYIPSYQTIMQSNLEACPSFTLHKYGLGSHNSEMMMSLFSEGFGSTLISMPENQELQRISVPILTLDDAIEKFDLPQPNVIKADIQGFELEMLKGAQKTLAKVDVLLLETWLYRGYGQECALLFEIMNWLAKFGFYLWDYGDCYREENGKLQTIDCVFVNSRTFPLMNQASLYEPQIDESEKQSLETELETLQSQNLTLLQQITAMESSKFWKLRSQWFKLKKMFGLQVS